ncbi:MAG: hypothetical protein AB8C95_00425 [Phycisphaeraceae bacterium]
MPDLIGWLWFHTWWSYAGSADPLHATIYRGINIVEGLFWVGFCAAVLLRYARNPHRKHVELAYALAFFCFGMTDFREAIALQSWLIWVKLFNLIVLLWFRKHVMKKMYPYAKLY